VASTYLTPVPRDFTKDDVVSMPLDRIAAAVKLGRSGTAMKSFTGILTEAEIDAVSAFVEREFVQDKSVNSAYHTAANGWPGHERFAAAFPYARGELSITAPTELLDDTQRRGRDLFMTRCISCHDGPREDEKGSAWSARPVSFPRMGFVPGQPNTPPVDAVSSASVYAKHEVAPRIEGLNRAERRGEALFQANCAFCHGADGSGKNWIGQFMEPKARDLTAYSAQTMPRARLRQVIRDGLPGTSMPAWRSVLKPEEIADLTAYAERALFRGDETRAAR
jgi:cytochrome c oxidase cbb3-type subunit 3